LKDSYADLDPDVDTRRVDIAHETGQQSFVDLLDGLLEKANNAEVFHRLVDEAPDEESKEALLAYYFLLLSPVALAKDELDRQIEGWFESNWNCTVDFEIDDALQKLLTLGLIEVSGDRLTAVDLRRGIQLLDQRWDNYFVPEN
jgi:hypothetical protein